MNANGLTTEELAAIALDLVGWSELPLDSAIYVPGQGIRRVAGGHRYRDCGAAPGPAAGLRRGGRPSSSWNASPDGPGLP